MIALPPSGDGGYRKLANTQKVGGTFRMIAIHEKQWHGRLCHANRPKSQKVGGTF
jgi:hypothetical protein